MRKVLFLMILLLLIGLGAASVKAQVRIGGNTAPSAAAVLDLNASDSANLATGGLVLPRVDLKTNVMQLTNGVANQTGTLVYNVTTTLGRIGVYYWNGNSWVLASLPTTTPADSGKVLVSTGSSWTFAQRLWYGALHLTTAVAASSYFSLPSSTPAGTYCINANPQYVEWQSSSAGSLTFWAYVPLAAGFTVYVMCFF